jgi:hypothetical protein
MGIQCLDLPDALLSKTSARSSKDSRQRSTRQTSQTEGIRSLDLHDAANLFCLQRNFDATRVLGGSAPVAKYGEGETKSSSPRQERSPSYSLASIVRREDIGEVSYAESPSYSLGSIVRRQDVFYLCLMIRHNVPSLGGGLEALRGFFQSI